MLNKNWNAIVNLMDDEKREQVHRELAPCSNEKFLQRYLELDEKFETVLRGFGILKEEDIMNNKEKRLLESMINKMMRETISDDYVGCILHHVNEKGKTFVEDVIEDVIECSDWNDEKYYNEDDIRLAIGIVLIDRLGIDY